MSEYELRLANEKVLFAKAQEGREYSKQQELAFWQLLLKQTEVSEADRLAMMRKSTQLELDILRERRQQREREAQQLAAVGLEDNGAAERMALAKVDAEATAARMAVELGQLTKSQLADLELQFESDRFSIQSAALQERLRLLALDPNTNPVEMARIKNEILLLEQEHQTRRNQLLGAATKEGSTLGGALGEMLGGAGTWQNALNGMLLQAQTWQQAMGNIFAQTGQIFVQKLVTEPAAAWLAGMAKMLLVKLGFMTQERAMDAAASTAKVGMKAVETTAVVSANAVQAGTGAAASQAAIPIVGPALALAAMAAIFAAVMALGSRKSARGGYDIPSGVNPMVQAHEEEMILPSSLANAVRRMAAQDEQGRGAERSPAFAPEPLPFHSMGDWVMLMRPHFVKMLNSAKRDFSYR